MQPSSKVRRRNGRNGREGRQDMTPKLSAKVRWAAEYSALELALSDPHSNVVRFGQGPDELLAYSIDRQFQLS